MSSQYLSTTKSFYTITGWLLLAESLLIFVPLSVLGSAINWPQSLGDPADKVKFFLGVSLFAGLWLAIVSLKILQTRILLHWLGFLGLVSATLLFVQLAELFGVDLGAFISVSVSVLHLWFLVMGIVLLANASMIDR